MHRAETERAHALGAFTAARPLLLITDWPPHEKGGGAVILQSLLEPDDLDRIVWATFSPLEADADDDHRVVSLAPARQRSLLQDATVRTGSLRQTVQDLVRSSGAAAAWIVAHRAAVRVAPAVAATGIPMHITVHDDPAWGHALLTRRYLALAPLLARDFRRSLRVARSLDVVSEPMAKRYRPHHFGDVSIVHRGIVGPVQGSPRYDDHDGVSVAVLGSTYGLREVAVLGQALARVQRKLGLPTRLTVIGGADAAGLRKMCPASVELELTGHLDERVGVAKLASSFLLYMCYPFSRRGRVLRTTSFPTKLSTYVTAARPLLLHVPSDSSVAFLADRSPYATLWRSMNPAEGADLITRLWANAATRQSFDRDAEDVRAQHFDRVRNRATLLEALNALADRQPRS